MTNHARGPSLIQARDNHNHRHLHSLQQPRTPQDGDRAGNHARSPEDNLQKRQVVIVQTVSILQIIDETGAIIGISTLLPDPVTKLPAAPAAVTDGLTALDNVPSAPTIPAEGAPLSAASSLAGSLLTSLPSASLPLLSSSETLTSAPSSGSSSFPTLSSGIYNSTRTPFFSNSTVLFSNSSRTSSSRSKTSTSGRVSSTSFASLFVIPTDVSGGTGGDPNANGVPPPAATSASPAPPSGPGLTPAAQSGIIGGVVGGFAGIALVALFLMFLLKWKKGHRNGLLLLGDGDSAIRGRGPSPGSNSGGGGGMAERTVPFAVPSALASLTGYKRAIEDTPSEAATGEKGFYRVSGRKLTSVLQSGGDGYSDPHASVISGTSDFRKSEAFIGSSSMHRLQLGSPMRPESGVPIIRSGPNRTPVQAQGPFSDDMHPVTPPAINPLGRSLTSRDDTDSRESNSRFAEDM